jgi:hypothetical protein
MYHSLNFNLYILYIILFIKKKYIIYNITIDIGGETRTLFMRAKDIRIKYYYIKCLPCLILVVIIFIPHTFILYVNLS